MRVLLVGMSIVQTRAMPLGAVLAKHVGLICNPVVNENNGRSLSLTFENLSYFYFRSIDK